MVRKSLLVAVLLATAAPLAAQEAPVEWTFGRPDGQAPPGVIDGQVLPKHRVMFGYRFIQMNSKGLWLNHDSLTLNESLQYYTVVPLTMVNQTHELTLAFAPTSTLTLSAHMTYSQRVRDALNAANDTIYETQSKGLGDLTVSALYSVYHQGAYRAHIQLGGIFPTGADNPTGETVFSPTVPESLPYDMRTGAGVYGILPGMTMLAQNAHGSVGAQVRGTFYIGTNSVGVAPGNAYEVTGWAAYKLNDFFSISGRMAYRRWDAMKGMDPSVAAYVGQDPGYNPYYAKGYSLQVPLGLNIYMPQGLHLGGNRLFVEYLRTVSQYYQGPHLGGNWGIVVGWDAVF